MSGWTKYVQTPKGGFPYIPGGDVCGIVEEVDPKDESAKFKKNDIVISRFYGTPSGALADFHIVKTALTTHKPRDLSAAEASAIPASVLCAVLLVEQWVRDSDR